ncbi:hypothetical protein OIU78_014662 [Salix suchowensis]|nr:hypothetical protein OIU78_014662 [Salix suchowensis]
MTRKRRSSSPAPLRNPPRHCFLRLLEAPIVNLGRQLCSCWFGGAGGRCWRWDFAGAGSAGERSEKPVDLDLEAPKIYDLGVSTHLLDRWMVEDREFDLRLERGWWKSVESGGGGEFEGWDRLPPDHTW